MARTNKFFHPKAHPGYSARNTTDENLRIGYDYWKERTSKPYLKIGRELGALATVEENRSQSNSRHFRAASREAFRRNRG